MDNEEKSNDIPVHYEEVEQPEQRGVREITRENIGELAQLGINTPLYIRTTMSINEVMAAAFEARILPNWIDTPEKAILAGQVCVELRIPNPITGSKMLYVIGTTPTLTTQGMLYLLKRAGIRISILRDFEPVYQTDNPHNFFLGGKMLYGADGQALMVDAATTTIELIDPKPLEGVRQITSYSWSDVLTAGLHNGGTWQKYPRDMSFNRCLSRAAKRFYSEVINGLPLADELDDSGVLYYDENTGEVLSLTSRRV